MFISGIRELIANLDKAKPFARGGQKAAGLTKIAEVPKDKFLACSVFLWMTEAGKSGQLPGSVIGTLRLAVFA